MGKGENSGTHELAQQRPIDVFVSYRLKHDHELALALRDLLTSAIASELNVFVAGAGGIRPDKIGFYPQLQAAAMQAKAFVAIITQESKSREWIFFEAGAAWGRQQLYAPLLVNTTPDDLGTSIAHYQAVVADDRNQVEMLIKSISEALGLETRDRFGTRFLAFSRRIEAHQRSDKEELAGPVARALQMFRQGDRETAIQHLDQLEADAVDVDERVNLRIERIWAEADLADMRGRFEALEPDLLKTCECQYWMGIFETRPAESVMRFEACLDLASDRPEMVKWARDASLARSQAKFRLGEEEFALSEIRRAMRSGDRHFRAQAVESWLRMGTQEPFEKLLFLASGVADNPESTQLFSELADLALAEKWSPLALWAARRAWAAGEHGTAANTLGNVYWSLGMPSLAYTNYSRAAEGGISVAKVNMANLLSRQAVPSAGLAVLAEHSGSFDAADPGYPYETRAKCERSRKEEEETASKIAGTGYNVATALAGLATEAVRGKKHLRESEMLSQSGDRIVIVEESESNAEEDVESQVAFRFVGKTVGLWVRSVPGSEELACISTEDSILVVKFSTNTKEEESCNMQIYQPTTEEAGNT